MPKISDGNTDLISNLLTNSQDPDGKPIKWKISKDSKKDEDSLPDFTADYTSEDGLKRTYSIDMSGAMGVISEVVQNQKEVEEKKIKAAKAANAGQGQSKSKEKEEEEPLTSKNTSSSSRTATR